MRSVFAGLIFAVSFVAVSAASRGAGPAEPLLRLVPSDAGVTLVVEDLRGHAREFFASPLAEGLGRLPAVRSWLASDRSRSLRSACRQIESLLGKPIVAIRDDLLGEAVVLTLRLPQHGRQEEARGMLLVRVRDRALLDRLIDGVNAAQKEKKELQTLVERASGNGSYWVREFPAATRRPAEYYTTLDDNTFAWSNSEEMVQGVIARGHGGRDGLGGTAGFRQVRDRLPARSAVSLFVDPRFLEGVMAASPRPPKAGDERVAAMLGRYVEALVYLGAAVEWRPGSPASRPALLLHTEEVIDPEKLPAWLRHWASRPAARPRLAEVPAGVLAAASAHVDFLALDEMIGALTPSQGQPRLDNLRLVLSGLMLGRDLRSAILPNLGPGVLAYLETQDAAGGAAGLSLVVSVDGIDNGGEAGIAAALDNSLRTILAAYALHAKHGRGQLQVESRLAGEVPVTALSPSSPFAYAVGHGRLVLARTAESVARAVSAERPAARHFLDLQARYFAGSETFLCADLEALHRFANSHRGAIARRIAAKHRSNPDDTRRDLDQALALMALFGDGFVTTRLASDARSAHRTLGLIVRDTPQAPAAP